MDSESEYGSSAGRSSKKTLIIVLSIVGGFVLLCGASCIGLGIWGYNKFGDVAQASISAEVFSTQLASGQVKEAYALTSKKFQEKQTLEDFKTIVQRYPGLTTPGQHAISSYNVAQTPDGPEANIQESISSSKGSHVVSLTLVKEDGQWKVDSMTVR